MNTTPTLLMIEKALSTPVPARTDTYTPIPHAVFLKDLRDMIYNANQRITDTKLVPNQNYNQLVGYFSIVGMAAQDVPEIQMSIGFKNSYDKSMSAAIAVGGHVSICSNGMISGDLLTFKRKHTGNSDLEVQEKLLEGVGMLNKSYTKLLIEADVMKSKELSTKERAELLGVMYFEEGLMTPTQLSMVKKELKESEHFKGNTAWDLYNNITHALKVSHPTTYLEDHIHLHRFMTDHVGLNPQQLTIEDQIADTGEGQAPEPMSAASNDTVNGEGEVN